jgi:hypothetical protein
MSKNPIFDDVKIDFWKTEIQVQLEWLQKKGLITVQRERTYRYGLVDQGREIIDQRTRLLCTHMDKDGKTTLKHIAPLAYECYLCNGVVNKSNQIIKRIRL